MSKPHVVLGIGRKNSPHSSPKKVRVKSIYIVPQAASAVLRVTDRADVQPTPQPMPAHLVSGPCGHAAAILRPSLWYNDMAVWLQASS